MKNKTHHQGRTKGSFSYSALTLADAAKINNNPTFKFLFSRKQLESLGATNLVTDRVSNLTEVPVIATVPEETAAAANKVVVTEL